MVESMRPPEFPVEADFKKGERVTLRNYLRGNVAEGIRQTLETDVSADVSEGLRNFKLGSSYRVLDVSPETHEAYLGSPDLSDTDVESFSAAIWMNPLSDWSDEKRKKYGEILIVDYHDLIKVFE